MTGTIPFYSDPLSWGGENDYGRDMFARGDYARMADRLADIKGGFILSINDVSEVCRLFFSASSLRRLKQAIRS